MSLFKIGPFLFSAALVMNNTALQKHESYMSVGSRICEQSFKQSAAAISRTFPSETFTATIARVCFGSALGQS